MFLWFEYMPFVGVLWIRGELYSSRSVLVRVYRPELEVRHSVQGRAYHWTLSLGIGVAMPYCLVVASPLV